MAEEPLCQNHARGGMSRMERDSQGSNRSPRNGQFSVPLLQIRSLGKLLTNHADIEFDKSEKL